MSGELIPSVSISHMLMQRESVRLRLTEALRLLTEAEEIAKDAHLGFPTLTLDGHRRGSRRLCGLYSNPEEAGKQMLQEVDGAGWQYLLEQSGIKSFMSADLRKKWSEQLYSGDVPPLDADSIRGTFGTLYAERGKMFEDGVVAVFKGLAWCYKTNRPQKFGKRIVMLLHGGSYPTTYGPDKLDDLLRVMHAVDKKPEPDHRNGAHGWLNSILRSTRDWPRTGENDYLSIKLFKNGNGHATFKRPDLVDELNRIIARRFPGALPAPK